MNYTYDCISDFIFVNDDLEPCDVILVPGGSHPQPAIKAAELYNQGMAKYILASGHANNHIPEYFSEAEFIKSIAVEMGVPPERIICENKASNTFENAIFSLEMLKNYNFRIGKFIIVCKAFHSRRALLTYKCVFPKNAEFMVASVTDKNGLSKENWFTNEDYVSKVMGEVVKIGQYFKSEIQSV